MQEPNGFMNSIAFSMKCMQYSYFSPRRYNLVEETDPNISTTKMSVNAVIGVKLKS